MYPIIIKKEPQKVSYSKEFPLDDHILTLAILRQYVNEEERFCIYETAPGHYSSSTILHIDAERLETQQETEIRVKKEELYMQNYTKFHSNKK